MPRHPIRPHLVIDGQPTPEELVGLKAEGFTAVVNLRRPEEPDQPLDPEAEGDRVRASGLDYLCVPVGGAPLSDADVEAVSDVIDRHAEGRVLLHCKQGGRAAALALLHIARAEQWPEDQVFERARAEGLELPPAVRALVESYLAR